MSMEKEVEFMEFEINPVDMLINQMNIARFLFLYYSNFLLKV